MLIFALICVVGAVVDGFGLICAVGVGFVLIFAAVWWFLEVGSVVAGSVFIFLYSCGACGGFRW